MIALKNRYFLAEMSLGIFLVFLWVAYHFFSPTLKTYQKTRATYYQMQKKLQTNQQNVLHEKRVKQQLTQLKQHHPSFHTLNTLKTIDQLSQQLSHLFIKNGLTVLAIKPIFTDSHEKATTGQLFTFTARGSYNHLIAVLKDINHYAWPMTIVSIKIHHAGIFKLIVTARGWH